MRGHARHRQPGFRPGTLQQIAAAAPFRVGHDRLAPDLVKGDVLRRMAGGGGDRHRGEHRFGVCHRPLQHLHAAHRAADDAEQLVDAEMLDQQLLRPHHVADGDHREGQAIGQAGRRVGVLRPAAAQAAAQHVGADDEIAVGVDRLAGADQHLPPAGLAGDGMGLGHEMVAGQGVADHDGVRAVGVQRAVGLVGDLEAADLDPAVQPHRPVDGQPHAPAGLDPVGGVIRNLPLRLRSGLLRGWVRGHLDSCLRALLAFGLQPPEPLAGHPRASWGGTGAYSYEAGLRSVNVFFDFPAHADYYLPALLPMVS